MHKRGVKKRTRRVKPKHRTLKRKNVKSRKFMRGGGVFNPNEIGKEKTGTIVLTKTQSLPGLDSEAIISLGKPFSVTYEISRIFVKRNRSIATFVISKISETADGANLLEESIHRDFVYSKPPSESYEISPTTSNWHLRLGSTEYVIVELK